MRRWVAAIVSMFSFVVIAAGAGAVSGPTVASGHWDGTAWSMTASDDASGAWSISMSFGGKPQGSEGGSLHLFRPVQKGQLAVGISFLAHTGIPRPDYVVGPVVSKATEVVITLSNGAVIRTRTIPPPKGFAPDIAFYAAQSPGSGPVVSAVGLDAAGRVVAHLKLP